MAIYSADFETTTDVMSKEETFVWAGAFVDITKHADDKAVVFFDSVFDFLYYLEYYFLDKDVIYFHNLKFDGSFIMNALFEDNFKFYNEEIPIEKCYKRRVFSTLISDMGIWYSIKVKIGKKIIEIRNSLTLVQGTVASIGDSFKTRKRKLDMDYDRQGDFDKPMAPEEKEYLACDVLIMAEALNHLINDFGFTRLTAGANAMNDFIERFGGKEKFRKYFPLLEEDEDQFIRNAYKGGFCYLKPGYEEVVQGKGRTYDVNSLYPSRMHGSSGNIYPIGKGKYFKGKPKITKKYPLWVAQIEIFARKKENKLPCVQIKKSSRFAENEWLETVGTITDGIEEPATIYITNVDWKMITECYEISYIKWINGYKYQGKIGLFDQFIDHWYEIKKTSTGALKQCAKIVLNSFYGKFGTKLSGKSKIVHQEDGILKFVLGEEEEHKGIYIPVAAFTTAYAREFTITAGNANYDRSIYFDTDSMHMTGWEDAEGITVSSTEMNCWDLELEWESAKFLRQKTYMETKGDKVEIKCAGMPGGMKYRKYLGEDGKVHKMPKLTYDDFYIGAEWGTGKLMAKQVKGGILLLDSPFKIRG